LEVAQDRQEVILGSAGGLGICHRHANFFLDLLPLGDVHDGAEDQEALLGLDRVEADLDREFAAVLAPAAQVASHPYGPRLRVGEEAGPVLGVLGPEAFRDQHLHQLPQQLVPP
jgi:hypothetical protein